MSTTITRREADDPFVDQFLAARPSYVFQQRPWQEALATLGHDVGYLCLEDSGRILMAQPAMLLRLGFFRLLWCGMPYGGAVGDADRSAEFWKALAGYARRAGAHRIRASRNHYDTADPPAGWRSDEHVQQVLHFEGRTEEAVWEGFKGRVRRDVRTAEKKGVVVATASDPADRDAIFEMYRRTMKRNESFVVWTRDLVERIWNELCTTGRGEILIARHEGQPLAGIATLYSGPQCFYFLGASSGEKRSLCPNDAVIWEGIRRARAKGCDDFDFMTSSRDDQALQDFKDKWGAVRYPFTFYELDVSPAMCKAWALAERLARSKLGVALLRLVGKA